MGFAPPPDAPPPAEQAAVQVEAGFAPSPTGAALCGVGIPAVQFSLAFQFPALPIPQLPPFDFFFALNCSLSDPIDADFSFGGGRVGQSDVDSDDELKNA